MKKLPLLISVPHAGLGVPQEVAELNRLNHKEIEDDSDGGAVAIYRQLEDQVHAFVTTSIARAFVDLNRADDDMRKDGVIKTHTCWDLSVYQSDLSENVIQTLLNNYYYPYHNRLSEYAQDHSLLLGIDCHTMAEVGPPVGPDPSTRRPWINLGDLEHTSCPKEWTFQLYDCFKIEFGDHVQLNQPFKGGWITRYHSRHMPWIQLEISREGFAPDVEKGKKVLRALNHWIDSFHA